MNANPDAAAVEINRLLEALEAIVNPGCCKGAGTSVFQVIGTNGRPTGEEVGLCEGCGREVTD